MRIRGPVSPAARPRGAAAARLSFGSPAARPRSPSAGRACSARRWTCRSTAPNPRAAGLPLAVQRIPATGPHTGTLVLLAGGPGQPAIPSFEQLIAPLASSPQLRGFELVAFDQRGTGQSGFLNCNTRRVPET